MGSDDSKEWLPRRMANPQYTYCMRYKSLIILMIVSAAACGPRLPALPDIAGTVLDAGDAGSDTGD